MKRLHPTTWLMFVCALVLCACAQLGVPAADTFNKRLLAGYHTVDAVANTASALRAAGKLSDADRDNVVNTGRTAVAGLDVARMLHATNPQAGEDRLTATIAVLTALQTYLATQGSK